MEDKQIKLEITSCYEHVALASRGLMVIVSRYYDSPDFVGEIELCFVEIANNTVEHAYLDSNTQTIWIELDLTPEQLIMRIKDNGEPMPESSLAQDVDWDALDKQDPESWETSGRGLQIVKDLMDEVTYTSTPEFNTFTFAKNVLKLRS